jgi:hypothetical protein
VHDLDGWLIGLNSPKGEEHAGTQVHRKRRRTKADHAATAFEMGVDKGASWNPSDFVL